MWHMEHSTNILSSIVTAKYFYHISPQIFEYLAPMQPAILATKLTAVGRAQSLISTGMPHALMRSEVAVMDISRNAAQAIAKISMLVSALPT